MDDRQMFKAAFLTACAEAGMTPDEIGVAVKEAIDHFKSLSPESLTKEAAGLLDRSADLASWVGQKGLSIGTGLALGTPPLLGMGAGLLAAKLTDIDDTDVAERRQQELIDEYKRLTEAAQSSNQAKTYAKEREASGRVFAR